jgi:hypothetical protein
MAKLQNFNGSEQINVSASVGAKGVNNRDDVIAIQALLRYALSGRNAFRGVKMPEITGSCDVDTIMAIRKYQEYLRRRNNIRVSIDGRIDPAKETSAFGKKGLWTMLMLNTEAMETWILNGGANGNYINDMFLQYPQLKSAIGAVPVGTLGLTLEPSRRGVGTLGLELE